VTLLVTSSEMRLLDKHVIESWGVPGAVLMETAGRAVAESIRRRREVAGAQVAVWCGPGNNGGDGFVAARWLHGWGADVEALLVTPKDRVKGDARVHLDAAVAAGVRLLEVADDAAAAEAAARHTGFTVVVDALFGTGLTRAIEGTAAAAVAAINVTPALRVAVDVPSGLDADRATPLGPCVRADVTVTFGFAKRGLVITPGVEFVGELEIADIGIPESLAVERGVSARLLDDSDLDGLRGPLPPWGHKGTRGHLLLVAGSPGKTGAALLTAHAALRTGVGLATLATPPAALPAIEGRLPELMTARFGDVDLDALLHGKRALVVGPGMSMETTAREQLQKLLAAAAALPVALDADALNHLAAAPDTPLPPSSVLTPHPGEAARLLQCSTDEVQNDRFVAAAKLVERYKVVVALKGARTIIASPDGRLAVCPAGNAALGTGGTGDVLAGCVGALLLGAPPFEAACAAVWLHSRAADQAAAERGQRGLMASDVIAALPAQLR
jgi:NAD(P)H-hydrate epimerase